ncbi:MAG: FAD binding domain-containing protein [Lachnospiraceae bacterium]
MIVKEFIRPDSVEEAVQLLKSRNHRLVGGTHWLKQGSQIMNAVSLDRLNLSFIEESDQEFHIGGTTSLREMERHPSILRDYPHIAAAYQHIAGVQLRNTATIGASVYSRFGFSDTVSTLLLLDTEIELNGTEKISLENYLEQDRTKKIVTGISIKKKKTDIAYYAIRKSAMDLPYFILGIAKQGNSYKVVCAARPQGPIVLKRTGALLEGRNAQNMPMEGDEFQLILEQLISEAKIKGNASASQEYREHLAKKLLKRGWESVCR